MKLTPEVTQGTRTFHLRDSLEGPGIDLTLVVRKIEDGSIEAAVAVCSPRDQFSRRIGRRIAFTRLMSRAAPVPSPNHGLVVFQARHFLIGATYQEIGELVFIILDDIQSAGSEKFYSELDDIISLLESGESVTGEDEIVPLTATAHA